MEGGKRLKRITDMFISFKGIRNDDVGARLIKMPTRQETALRGTKQTLPGRDGILLVPTGYKEITIKQDMIVPDNEDMPAVREWLSGSGDLVFGDFPEYAYDAMIISPFNMSSPMQRLEGQKFTVTFTCQPFRHLVKEKTIELTSGRVFNGQGDVNSMPLIKVEGSGSETLIVNGRSMILTLTSDVPLYIDCDAGTAYTMNNATLVFAGDQVIIEDDWFELYPKSRDTSGWNNVNFTSGITKVTLTPRWRWF